MAACNTAMNGTAVYLPCQSGSFCVQIEGLQLGQDKI